MLFYHALFCRVNSAGLNGRRGSMRKPCSRVVRGALHLPVTKGTLWSAPKALALGSSAGCCRVCEEDDFVDGDFVSEVSCRGRAFRFSGVPGFGLM